MYGKKRGMMAQVANISSLLVSLTIAKNKS